MVEFLKYFKTFITLMDLGYVGVCLILFLDLASSDADLQAVGPFHLYGLWVTAMGTCHLSLALCTQSFC